jgi:hypothetical protein
MFHVLIKTECLILTTNCWSSTRITSCPFLLEPLVVPYEDIHKIWIKPICIQVLGPVLSKDKRFNIEHNLLLFVISVPQPFQMPLTSGKFIRSIMFGECCHQLTNYVY